MLPFIKDGREVTLTRPADDTYRPGDIVLALASIDNPAPGTDERPVTDNPAPGTNCQLPATSYHRVVLHYVVAVNPDGAVTLMGAANLRQTERCHLTDMAGRVTLPHVSRRAIILWHRLLPVRRYLLRLLRLLRLLP